MTNLFSYSEFLNEIISAKTPEERYFGYCLKNKFPSRDLVGKLIEKIKKNCKEIEKDLVITSDSKEQDILDQYVSIEYTKINPELREDKLSKSHKKLVEIIDEVISRYKLKNEIILYRSVTPKAIEDDIKGFKSLTLSPVTACNFKKR